MSVVSRLKSMDHGPKSVVKGSHFVLYAMNFGLRTLDYGLRNLDNRLWTLDFVLWASDFGLRTMEHQAKGTPFFVVLLEYRSGHDTYNPVYVCLYDSIWNILTDWKFHRTLTNCSAYFVYYLRICQRTDQATWHPNCYFSLECCLFALIYILLSNINFWPDGLLKL